MRGLDTGNYYGQKVGNTLHFEDGTVIAGTRLYKKGSTTPEPLPVLQGVVAVPRSQDIFRRQETGARPAH